jgi:5-methylthioadenosine/S-adenosylhomocysteine deaminase
VLRKRAGRLVGLDVTRLTADVMASRDYLLEVSGYRPDMFGTAAAMKPAA